ncbi:MAG: phosphate ABC transporter ATP-binding protein [Deltaproteobacteria bacterium]|nr:phosphate ABC transporter ATP-binding protein [Deltaproteobacteria bacterium]
MSSARPKIEMHDIRLSYGTKEVLHGVTLDVRENEILAIIGPAQSGKTSLLRCINRTIDFDPMARRTGSLLLDGEEVGRMKDVHELRRRIGMVAPLPVGLPLTIFDNVAFAPRMSGIRDRDELAQRVERCLRQAALWDEVKDRLHTLGTRLSGGQQQRLTIARALSHDPEVLCLDEFSIAIDPVTTMRIEDVLQELRAEITIILVTNLVQQARRLAHRTAFLLNGELVELDATEALFSAAPRDQRSYDYVHGVFG